MENKDIKKNTFSEKPDFDCTKTDIWRKLLRLQRKAKVKFDVALVTNL